jgi:hypothetical protein
MLFKRDNGRVVKLLSIVGEHCPVCGGYNGPLATDIGTVWHVEPADGHGKFLSEWAIHDRRTAVFVQSHLIPLGDEDLEIEIAAETAAGDATDLHTVSN